MAYGLKYYYNFSQIKNYTNDSYRIEIYKEGYASSSTEINNIAGGSISVSRDGDVLEVVQGTKMSFGLYNDTEGLYKEFREAAYGDYMIKLIQDPTGTPLTKFVGYNQSEIYTESYDQPPYTATLEWTCGLSHLKHVRFDNSGTLYTGQKTIIEVLRLCLNKLGNPLAIRDIVNVYEDSINATTTDSMLNQIYVDVSVYKEQEQEGGSTVESGFFCNEVLEEILKPFLINVYQDNGIWYVVRVQEYLDTTIYYRDFNANVGTESTVTVDGTGNYTTNKRTVTGTNGTATELVLVAPSSEMSIEPPYNRVKVEYNQENLDVSQSNLIKNGCFEVRKTTTGAYGTRWKPDFWTFTGNDYTTYNAMIATLGKWWFQFDETAQKTAATFSNSVYMEYTKTNIPTATNDSLQFSFTGRIETKYTKNAGGSSANSPYNFVQNTLFTRWEVEIQLGIYYLHGDPVTGYSWVASSGRATFDKIGFTTSGLSAGNLKESFDIVQILPTLPQNAIVDLRIRVYRPYSNWSSYASTNTDYTMVFNHLWQTCFKLIYLPDELPPIEELVLYSKIDEDENLLEIETLHGDGTNSITLNSFRLSSGLITDNWNRRGVSDNAEILNILLKQLRDLRGEFTKSLSALLIGEIDIFNTIEHTTDEATQYYIKTYNWNVETNEYDVTLSELATSVIALTIDNSTLLSPVDVTGTGNGSNSGDFNDPISTQSMVMESSATALDQNNLNNFV